MTRRRPRGRADDEDRVPHPRYGVESRPSGHGFTAKQLADAYWGYRPEVLSRRGATMFPESAIPADPARQNFSTFARCAYVDILERCRACERPFIFFAAEQRHWYEELRFYVDAECVHCPACRGRRHRVARALSRYSAAIVDVADLDDAALATLAEDAVTLWDAGVLRDPQKLARLRNLALRRIPRSRAAARIARAGSRDPST